jgi:glycine/D-amino acid oxidase-like deaminating enzyme
MPQPLRLIETSPNPPACADVVVIGGGIVGVFSAYYLARRGLSVAVVEKGRIGAEQSSRNWGWCRQQNRDARELPMATKSLELWERFAADSGEDTGFRRCGLLYLTNDEAELSRWSSWRDFAKTAGVTTHMLSGHEATQRGQATGRPWKGGVFSPSDGTADPSKAAPAVAAALMKLGGSVHQHCAARGIELQGGRVSGVVTEAGPSRPAWLCSPAAHGPPRSAVSSGSGSPWPLFANPSCACRPCSIDCRTPCTPRGCLPRAAATAATPSRSAGAGGWT